MIIVLTFPSVAAAQSLLLRTPPPPGVDISASDGDRIVIEDDARIQIVRRQRATIRTIFSTKEQVLIVLADYGKPGEFPDGLVDWAFNFYQVQGPWPLGARWEALTAIYQYQGNASRHTGFAIETPQGLVWVVPRGQEVPASAAPALAVLFHSGTANGPRHQLSFAEAEKIQLHDFVRSKASGATVGTAMTPDGRFGTAVLSGGIRKSDSPPPQTRGAAPPVAPPAVDVVRQPNVRTPPPVGQEIAASDGDRVIVDDDARVQIVRRRKATVRTIFNRDEQFLIVLADYARPGESPDGRVDWAANFFGVEGTWPLEATWEASTTIFQYEGDPPMPMAFTLVTPHGPAHLRPSRLRAQEPDANAGIVIFHAAMSGGRSGLSFAEAEKAQVAEAVKRSREGAPRGGQAAP